MCVSPKDRNRKKPTYLYLNLYTESPSCLAEVVQVIQGSWITSLFWQPLAGSRDPGDTLGPSHETPFGLASATVWLHKPPRPTTASYWAPRNWRIRVFTKLLSSKRRNYDDPKPKVPIWHGVRHHLEPRALMFAPRCRPKAPARSLRPGVAGPWQHIGPD